MEKGKHSRNICLWAEMKREKMCIFWKDTSKGKNDSAYKSVQSAGCDPRALTACLAREAKQRGVQAGSRIWGAGSQGNCPTGGLNYQLISREELPGELLQNADPSSCYNLGALFSKRRTKIIFEAGLHMSHKLEGLKAFKWDSEQHPDCSSVNAPSPLIS